MDIRVLILLPAPEYAPYPYLKHWADKTWNSIAHAQVDVLFFTGDTRQFLDGNLYHTGTTANPPQHERSLPVIEFKAAANYVWNRPWDFIVSGSISSYFHKPLVYNQAAMLPKEKCFFGRGQRCGEVGLYNGLYASGCGVFYSRDVVDILRKHLPEYPHPYGDVLVGEILSQHGISVTSGAELIDIYDTTWPPPPTYHYRCRNSKDKDNREWDVDAFKALFSYLNVPGNPEWDRYLIENFKNNLMK